MNPWKLSESDYRVLLSYIGCGNFPDADIIVFGNEEGTGGYSVEANIKARVERYGKQSEDKAAPRTYCIEGGDWTKGFYEPSAQGGGKKVEIYAKANNEKIIEAGFTAGVFNPAIARICMALEHPNSENWFQGAEENDKAWSQIKRFVVDRLYEPRTSGIQTALADWRPLPRDNEKVWPTEYEAIALPKQNNACLDAFNKPKAKFKAGKCGPNPFSDFHEDMKFRLNVLKRLFESSKATVLIGIGGASGFKKEALELMYGSKIFKPLPFDQADMRNAKGQQLKAYSAAVPLTNKTLHLFLIPFPDQGNVFKTQADALAMLKELTDRYVQPALKR